MHLSKVLICKTHRKRSANSEKSIHRERSTHEAEQCFQGTIKYDVPARGDLCCPKRWTWRIVLHFNPLC